MSTFSTVIHLIYLISAVCFVRGLHLMNSPITARTGNLLSAGGMGAAVAATLASIWHDGDISAIALLILLAGLAVGSAAGLYGARAVKMTDMPQLVSIFNAVGGGAAALVAIVDTIDYSGAFSDRPTSTTIAIGLDLAIGAVTFSGSLIAAGKLQGLIPGRPITLPGQRFLSALLALAMIAGSVGLLAGGSGAILVPLIGVAALGFGVTMVLPIGGADMPVVISLLNAFTGTAVAMAGFVLSSTVLITAGALVGASGTILTMLMAKAMNRSLANIVVGGFGTSDSTGTTGVGTEGVVRSVGADDVAVQLAYANTVVIIPGFGLAAAQAQRELVDLANSLTERGVNVSYAIHPVAGRMPGHMNVLLAEAHVPYQQMKDLDEANQLLAHTDVALVVGANDVVNPAARTPGSDIFGMPILNADKATSVIAIKRSMGHGYAGIDNELFSDPRTGMLFADAKQGLADIAAAITVLVG